VGVLNLRDANHMPPRLPSDRLTARHGHSHQHVSAGLPWEAATGNGPKGQRRVAGKMSFSSSIFVSCLLNAYLFLYFMEVQFLRLEVREM
jgi:hypothetical protein